MSKLAGHFARAAFLVLIVGCAGRAREDLLGTSVTGQLTFNGGPTNYFDPANGFVLAGSLNTAGTTVTVQNPAVEFGFADLANTDTANFTGTTLTVTDVVAGTTGSPIAPFTMTFTDAAFAGLPLSVISDTFSTALTASLVGTTLTITAPSEAIVPGSTYSLSLNISSTPVPEPSSLALLGAPVAAWAGRRWLRRRAARGSVA
jgi:hypothetical protein